MERVLAEIAAELGDDILRIGEDVPEHVHAKDYAIRGRQPLAVVYPRSGEDVSAIMRVCNARGQAVVPQGGMSGLAGGGVSLEGELVLSLSRMNEIEEIDLDAGTMTVQAGVILQTVQEAADAAGMLFPLDLGGRGSCQVGGMAATNAGGNRVLRYGMARALILGIEAVLPDGQILSSLNKMLKNNAGYDLKHLFIGSEGTLGVITRLVLRIFPKALSETTAFCAATDYRSMLDFLRRCNQGLAGQMSAFEVMWPDFYEVAIRSGGRSPPLAPGQGMYVLVEALGSDQEADQARLEEIVYEALQAGELCDGVIAQSMRDTKSFWDLRDAPGEFRQTFWPNVAFDVSLPIGAMARFADDCRARLAAEWPNVECVFFGHVADSNLHIVVRLDLKPFPKRRVEEIVYSTVGDYAGSISAEHGIGVVKLDFLSLSRSTEELELMRTLKKAIDPNNILNPGKVIPVSADNSASRALS